MPFKSKSRNRLIYVEKLFPWHVFFLPLEQNLKMIKIENDKIENEQKYQISHSNQRFGLLFDLFRILVLQVCIFLSLSIPCDSCVLLIF
jgi:hypothetical protein